MEKINKVIIAVIAFVTVSVVCTGCSNAEQQKAALAAAAEQQKAAFDAAVETAVDKKVAALEAERLSKRPVVQIILPAEYRNAEVLVTFGATTPKKVEQKKSAAVEKKTTK